MDGIDGVLLTPLKIIPGDMGSVMHAVKKTDPGFQGFGEAYFSTVRKGVVKGWKRHREMTLNLAVPLGEIRFVIYDDRPDSPTKETFQDLSLSPRNYFRLTVPPLVWMAFQGVSKPTNMLLNVASILHDPSETDSRQLGEIGYDW